MANKQVHSINMLKNFKWLLFFCATVLLVSCGGGNKHTSEVYSSKTDSSNRSMDGNVSNSSTSSLNKTPVISGNPITSISRGALYFFIPIANDPNGDPLIYDIQNKPSWGTFDTKTGMLSGTPNTDGEFKDILITTSDGVLIASLPPFNIFVTSQASTSDIKFAMLHKGVTPFIKFIQLNGKNSTNIKSVSYIIEPKPNSTSKPVAVTYSMTALKERDYVSADNDLITLPIFGLYAGYNNQVSIQISFNDDSVQTIPINISTDIYTDAKGVYDHPVFIKTRIPGAALGFDFFAIKSGLGTPIIVDTDGEIRWIGVGITNSGASIFHNNGFIVGEQTSTKFHQLEFDGSIRDKYLLSSTYTNFHHNIDMGKYGFLSEVDATSEGAKSIESILAEFTNSGVIIKEWDFAKLISDYMTTNGDVANTFVRPGVDWFHINASTYDPSDNTILVSSRENFIMKVDYDTGAIIWILGDPLKYWFTFPSLRAKAVILEDGDLYPIGQHAVSITSDGLVMVFNNGLGSVNQPLGAPAGGNRNYSAISAYKIDDKSRAGKEVWRFDYGTSILSDICSSVYEAPDKSLLISYATSNNRKKARLVGLDKNHEVIFDFEYPTSVCNASWNAIPVNFENMNIN